MAGTFTVNGGNTTVAFSYTQPTTTVVNILTSAAHYLHINDPNFGSLTNQQKLDIVDAYIKQQVIALARTYDIKAAADAATTTATATADTNIIL